MVRQTCKFLFAGMVTVALFTGCAKYKPQPFSIPEFVPQEKGNVAVVAQSLSEPDCKRTFGRKVVSKGYQPIQLVVRNNTKNVYTLDGADINLNLEPAHIVAKRIHFNTAGRIMAWGIPGLFMWPFLIPAVVDGVKSSNANKKINIDFSERCISPDSHIIIQPHMIMNRIMFVATRNFRSTFKVTLMNKDEQQPLSFNITA